MSERQYWYSATEELFKDSRTSKSHIHIFGLIKSLKAGNCPAKKLVEWSGICRATVFKSLKELAEWGYLKKDGSRYRLNSGEIDQSASPDSTAQTQSANPDSKSASPDSKSATSDSSPYIDKTLNKTLNEKGDSHPLDEYFLHPDGCQDWEKLNQHILGDRLPMKDYPNLMLAKHELQEVIDDLQESGIQPDKFHLVFRPAAQTAKQQLISGKGLDTINCVKWLMGWCKLDAMDQLRKQNYFDKSRGEAA